MQPTTILAKSITLISFIILLSGFVAYRSGVFDRYLHKNRSGNEQAIYAFNEDADTTKKPDTTIPQRRMMPGSKAMVLPDPPDNTRPAEKTAKFIKDTSDFIRLYSDLLAIKKEDSIRQQKKIMLSSSKSSRVFETKETAPYIKPVLIHGRYRILLPHQVDSVLNEMNKVYPSVRPAVEAYDSVKKRRSMMPSTKSGSIIRQKDLN